MRSSIPMNTILGPASEIGVPNGRESSYPVVRVAGSLHISGDVRANVSADGSVVIGGEARIRGNIMAESVIIGGIVLGDIIASDGVTLLSTSVVLGNIAVGKVGTVRVDDGAVLTGTVKKEMAIT